MQMVHAVKLARHNRDMSQVVVKLMAGKVSLSTVFLWFLFSCLLFGSGYGFANRTPAVCWPFAEILESDIGQ